MKIFINDIPVYLVDTIEVDSVEKYDHVLDGQAHKIVPKQLIDDVLIQNAGAENVYELLQLMTEKKFKNVDSITFSTSKLKPLVKFIKTTFRVIEAAGGVVEKENQNLLIFRKGKWDLPKGKIDKGEKKRACAIREVEEETGVKVEITEKICHTWHTYMHNRKFVLKKTHWYVMSCLDDSLMAPQAEEDIDEVMWKNLTEIRLALYDSYRSIRTVIHEYHKVLKLKAQKEQMS
ncbi:MAG: 8-oxo-dGTP pyrophosphatase MutT (NUDIX family) [Cyclobacteriaceae bacterium]